jgi:CrcB protein
MMLAGALGTLARYVLAGVVQRLVGGEFPVGTLAVNVLGCFLFGLVWGLSEQRVLLSPEVRLPVLTGFMGAFTTFSTFAFETEALARHAHWWGAVGNLVGHNVLGLLAVVIGLGLASLATT